MCQIPPQNNQKQKSYQENNDASRLRPGYYVLYVNMSASFLQQHTQSADVKLNGLLDQSISERTSRLCTVQSPTHLK